MGAILEAQGRWNPRPFVPWSDDETSDYRAGYSDGWYGARFGAGHDGSRTQNAYRAGFNDGRADAGRTTAGSRRNG